MKNLHCAHECFMCGKSYVTYTGNLTCPHCKHQPSKELKKVLQERVLRNRNRIRDINPLEVQ